MNITHAQVSQVTKTDDGYLVPPAIICRRSWHLSATVLYDLIKLKVDWNTLERLGQELDMPSDITALVMIETWIQTQGRMIIDEYLSPVGIRSHVEPVEG